MRFLVRAVLLVSLLSSGCSKALGYDDIQFSPPPGAAADGGPDTSVADGASDATGDASFADAAPGDGGTDADDAAGSPCDGVSCSGQGSCVEVDGGAGCTCNAGFHAEGLACVADESCSGVDCGRCGQCEVIAGKATCTCPQGFEFTGSGCQVSPDPCTPNPCDADHVCVPEAHCQPLGACVPTCDCSNCGNCGPDNSDGRWDDWQEYCGNLNSSPATMACNKPCPAGDGCIPYDPPLCWPMEGCLSL